MWSSLYHWWNLLKFLFKFHYKVYGQSLWTVNGEQWNTLKVNLMEQNIVTDAISSELRQTMDSLCMQCGLGGKHFIDPTCNVRGVYYTGSIVYSIPEGDLMASTLVALLQQWLLEADINEMQVIVAETHLVLWKLMALSTTAHLQRCSVSLHWQQGCRKHAANESSLNTPQTHTYAVISGCL